MSQMEISWIVVDTATKQEARIRVYKKRCIVFRATKATGSLSNRHVVVSYNTGRYLDGRITSKLTNKARTKARVAMNAQRRKPKYRSKKL